jgi:hypothetical protein
VHAADREVSLLHLRRQPIDFSTGVTIYDGLTGERS